MRNNFTKENLEQGISINYIYYFNAQYQFYLNINYACDTLIITKKLRPLLILVNLINIEMLMYIAYFKTNLSAL